MVVVVVVVVVVAHTRAVKVVVVYANTQKKKTAQLAPPSLIGSEMPGSLCAAESSAGEEGLLRSRFRPRRVAIGRHTVHARWAHGDDF